MERSNQFVHQSILLASQVIINEIDIVDTAHAKSKKIFLGVLGYPLLEKVGHEVSNILVASLCYHKIQ